MDPVQTASKQVSSSLQNNHNFKIKLLISLVVLILILTSGYGGYYLGQKNINKATVKKPNNLYFVQSASIFGKITKIDGDNLTVQNTAGTKIFAADKKIQIVKLDPNTKKIATSSGLAALELNRNGLIVLSGNNNIYKIMAVNYLVSK